MKIMIEKDAATKLQKEVADLDEARGYAENGFHVSVENEDGTYTPLSEVLAEGAPDPDADRAAAEAQAFANSGKTEAQWKKLSKAVREELIAAEMPKG